MTFVQWQGGPTMEQAAFERGFRAGWEARGESAPVPAPVYPTCPVCGMTHQRCALPCSRGDCGLKAR